MPLNFPKDRTGTEYTSLRIHTRPFESAEVFFLTGTIADGDDFVADLKLLNSTNVQVSSVFGTNKYCVEDGIPLVTCERVSEEAKEFANKMLDLVEKMETIDLQGDQLTLDAPSGRFAAVRTDDPQTLAESGTRRLDGWIFASLLAVALSATTIA